MSHYVKVNARGVPLSNPGDVAYDEIVIPQESQIAPAFILHLERSNFRDIAEEWDQICQHSVDAGTVSVPIPTPVPVPVSVPVPCPYAIFHFSSIYVHFIRNDRLEKTLKVQKSEPATAIFNPREIPLSRDSDSPADRMLMDGDRYTAPVPVARRLPGNPRELPLGTPNALEVLPGTVTNQASPNTPQLYSSARAADEASDLKAKAVGVLTGQFVQTKATHISLNPLLLRQRGPGKERKDEAWDYQRGAETKGGKLPKAYVRKATHQASCQEAVALRQELVKMQSTEVCARVARSVPGWDSLLWHHSDSQTFHSSQLHWTLFTEFEEIQYFNYCRLLEEKPDAIGMRLFPQSHYHSSRVFRATFFYLAVFFSILFLIHRS
jgi:hypothetical protein